MPNDDLYDDAGGESTASEPAKAKDEGHPTALLAKSFFGDKPLEPGTRCEVEIQRVMDDQVQVVKVPESEYKAAEDEEEMSAAEEPMTDMMA